MATMNVKDAAGSTVAVEKPLTPGQATMVASRPVVIASDQSTVPVSLASVPSHAVTLTSTTITGTVAVTESGTWTVQPGNTANTTPWLTKIHDGTTATTIKAASTAAVAADPALVVAISPNNYDFGSGTGGTKTQRMIIDTSQLGALGQTTMSSSAPVVIASDQSAIRTLPGVTATASGATASRINAAATTNATNLKASAGQLYTIDVFNVAAYNVFLKLYNKASAPTVGTDTPIMTIPVQAGGGFSKTWPMGLTFATGISYAITKLQADSDTTVLAAGDLTGTTTWI